MKTVPSFSLLSCAATRELLFVFCIASLLLVEGCGKNDSASENAVVAPTTSAPSEISHAPVYATPAKPAVVATPAGEVDFNSLNRELRRWILRNQRPPKNFEEFAASAGIQFPPPPAGKKYAIDKTMHVVLVKQ